MTVSNTVALGANTEVSADNSVALGAGSVADEENVVSVGAAGSERRILNVAPGVDGTDAVNFDQLSVVSSSGGDHGGQFCSGCQ